MLPFSRRRRRRRRIAFILAFAVLVLLIARNARAETQEVTLPDGRLYHIDLPADPDGAPLILALHGGAGDPVRMAAWSGLGTAALAEGYAVAFAAGTGRRTDRLLAWNAGYCCGLAQRQGVDDMAYLRAVIADAGARFAVDPDRIYLVGVSNGAMMVEAFAATHPALVRAVAGVSGTMDVARFPVQGRVPLLVMHGTADPMVPFAGGRGPRSLTQTDFASVAAVVAAFLSPWGADLTVTETQIDAVDDGTGVQVTDHRKGTTVILRQITIAGGGHDWPGALRAVQLSGRTQEIDANAELLRFFALHP